MFNSPINVTGTLQDVLYKCKISGSIVADPGTGDQILLAYSRYTGELLGSAVWDASTKTYELFIQTIEDEKVYLTRIDNNGQYFAETYDRLSLCTVTNVHGSEYFDLANTSFTSQNLTPTKSQFSFPFNIIYENLKKVEGTFSFVDGYDEATCLVGGAYYSLGRKANGVLYSDDGVIVCDAGKSQNFTIKEIINSLDDDPFGDGSLIAAYPVIFNGKDVKRLHNSDSNKSYRYARSGYLGAFDDPRYDFFNIPIVINRASTTTIHFEFSIGSSSTTSVYCILMYIPNLMQVYIYNTSLYWEYVNAAAVTQTVYTLTWASNNTVTIVISPSGSDKLYLNGVLLTTKTISAPNKVNQEYFSFPMTRGYNGNQILTLTGVQIFNRELTLAEIQLLPSKGSQKRVPIPQNINYVKESSGSIVSGETPQEYYEVSNYLKDGSLTNDFAYDSWNITHYGLTVNKDNVTFNGTTGVLFRDSTRNTASMDIVITFTPTAVTAQCIWKIGNETNGVAIGINASAKITLYVRTAGALTSLSLATTIVSGTTYTFVLTDGNLKLISSTGTELESIANSLTIGNFTGVESIGAAYNGSPIAGTSGTSGYFSGSIYQLLLADANTYDNYAINPEYSISVFSDDVELPIELVKWDNANNVAVLWTKIPVINSTGTSIKITSNAPSKPGDIGSKNAQDVWNKDFLAVYHMNYGTKLIDSTSGKLHGLLTNIDSSNFVAHETGSSLVLNGTDEYAQVSLPIIKGLQRLSIAAIFTPNSIADGDVLIDVALSDSANSGLQCSMQFDSLSMLNASLIDNSNASIGSVATGVLISSEEHFVNLDYTGKVESNGLTISVDGVQVDSESSTGKRISNSNAKFTIGKDTYSANYYDGSISELFIRNKPMSADFEKLIRLSTKDELGSYTIKQGTNVQYEIPYPINYGDILLIHSNTVDGSAIFKDSSVVSPNAVSAYGGITHSTNFHKFGTSSILFNGSSTYLKLGATQNFCVGTGDFTLELWFYYIGESSPGYFFDLSSNEMVLQTNGAGCIRYYNTTTGTSSALYTTLPSLTNIAWNHIAVCRVSGVTSIYINGTLQVSAADTHNYAVSSKTPTIGRYGGSTTYFLVGYIDEFLFSNYSKYTSNFTPPTLAYGETTAILDTTDEYWNNVVLAMPMNGIDNSQYIQDLKNKTVAALGNAKLSVAQKKFGVTSAYFDGTGDYLSIPDSVDFDLLTDDFTVELFAQFQAIGSIMTLVGNYQGSTIGWAFQYRNTNTLVFGNGDTQIATCAFTPVIGTWYHLAATRSSGSLFLFINGVLQVTVANSTNISGSTNPLVIGALYYSGSYIQNFNGYIDDLRITKGIARYVSNFTVPVQSLEESCPIYNIIKNDTYWYNTTLALDCESINDIKGKTLTANAVSLNSNIKKHGDYSFYFTGGNSYVSIPYTVDLSLGSGDFTVESWVHPISFGSTGAFVCGTYTYGTIDGGTANSGWYFGLNSTGAINFGYGNNGAWIQLLLSTTTIPVNTWTHIAVSRVNGTLKLFINGTLDTTIASAQDVTVTKSYFYVGSYNRSDAYAFGTSISFNGYIDDVRITKGVGRYTASFTLTDRSYFDNTDLSVQVDPYWNNVVLALPMEVVSDATTFFDIKNNLRFTTFGNASILNYAKIGNGSLYLDGAGDYLQLDVTNNTDFDIILSDFTIEMFVFISSTPSGGDKRLMSMGGGYAGWTPTTGLHWLMQVNTSDLRVNFQYYTGAGGTSIIHSTPLTVGSWYHIAISRVGSNAYISVNGVIEVYSLSTFVKPSATPVYLNIGSIYGEGTNYFNGYIDELRITKGIGRYMSNFTPPTQSIFNFMEVDQYWSNVVFLSNFNGVNNSTSFIDAKNKTITAYGNAKISTGALKYGISSAYFDGTGGYLSTPNSFDFHLSNVDFTVECWLYITSNPTTTNDYRFVISRDNIGVTRGWTLTQVDVTGKLSFTLWDSNSTNVSVTDISAPVINTWIHVAATRSNGTLRLFVNGVMVASAACTITCQDANCTTLIGTNQQNSVPNSNGAWDFHGYIDDLRVTKGVALYVENFTPPTQQLGVYSIADTGSSGNVYLEFAIGSNVVNSIEKEVPIMLRLSDNSGLSNLDATDFIESVKTANTKPYGLNPRNSEFGIRKSGLSDFNTPYITKTSNRFDVKDAAYRFTGNVNSIINITSALSRSLLMYNLTFSMWVRLETLSAPSTEYLLFGTPGVNEFQLTHRWNGELVYRHTSSGVIAGYLRRNRWTHVLITRDYNNKVVNCYVDGILRSTYTYSTNPAISSDSIYIGGSPTYASACSISDVRIFDRVLSADMIQRMYHDSYVHFVGISTSILYQDVPILLGESLNSITVYDSGNVYYALSQDKRTYYVFNTVWKAVVTNDPTIHGFTGETEPYYWDDDSSEWVFSNMPMEDTISLAMQYFGNRMNKAALNARTDFSGIYSSAVGTMNIAVIFDADGVNKHSFDNVVFNNKQYWISESFALSDFCDTVTSSAVLININAPDTVIDYAAATKIYCKLDNDSSWVECVNGTIPNIPVGLNTTGRSVIFKVVWDISVWITPRDFSLELVIK